MSVGWKTPIAYFKGLCPNQSNWFGEDKHFLGSGWSSLWVLLQCPATFLPCLNPLCSYLLSLAQPKPNSCKLFLQKDNLVERSMLRHALEFSRFFPLQDCVWGLLLLHSYLPWLRLKTGFTIEVELFNVVPGIIQRNRVLFDL